MASATVIRKQLERSRGFLSASGEASNLVVPVDQLGKCWLNYEQWKVWRVIPARKARIPSFKQNPLA